MNGALRKLNEVVRILKPPQQAIDRTTYLYKKALDEYPKKVKNHNILIAACLLLALRELEEEGETLTSNPTLGAIHEAYENCGLRINIRAVVQEANRFRILTGYTSGPRKAED